MKKMKNANENESYFNHDDIKHSSSTPNIMKVKVNKTKKDSERETKEEFLNCDICNFKCKKETILKKHMITKHEEHPCKECDKKLTTFMDLVQHVAKHLLKEGKVNDEVEAELGKDKEKEPGNQDESMPDFKLKESVMDECIK